MDILLIIIVLVLLFLLGSLIYRQLAKSIAKVHISYAYSCLILLLGFAGCAVFVGVFSLLGIGSVTFCEPILVCLIPFIFGTTGIQAFIYFFMTKSADGVRITRMHAFIFSVIFFMPGLLATLFIMGALIVYLTGGT